MHALAKFRQFLVRNKFIVRTDHNNLHHFLGQKDLNEWQHISVSKTQAYEFDIEYVKGKKNVVADALSRKETTCSLMKLTENWKAHLATEYAKN